MLTNGLVSVIITKMGLQRFFPKRKEDEAIKYIKDIAKTFPDLKYISATVVNGKVVECRAYHRALSTEELNSNRWDLYKPIYKAALRCNQPTSSSQPETD